MRNSPIPVVIPDTCSAPLNAFEQTVQPGRTLFTHSPYWYSMVSADVSLDPRISDAAKCAYQIMALYIKKGSPITSVGMRRLGQLMGGRSAASAAVWVEELERYGNIERSSPGRGKRNVYRFTSPIFNLKAHKEAISHSAARPLPRLRLAGQVTMRECGICKRLCRSLPSTGICRNCKRDGHTERISERVARRVVREEKQVAKALDPTERTA